MTLAKDQHSEEDINMKSGFFLRGRLYGKGEIIFKNSDHYLGNFKGTKRDGYGVMNYNVPRSESDYTNMGVYKGNWKSE